MTRDGGESFFAESALAEDMRPRNRALLLFVSLLAVVALWLRGRPDTSSGDARRLVAAGAQLIDVRSPEEFAAGHLPGARNIPVDALERRLDEVGARDRPVVVYCASGVRAASAARILTGAGFASVHNLGAMSAW